MKTNKVFGLLAALAILMSFGAACAPSPAQTPEAPAAAPTNAPPAVVPPTSAGGGVIELTLWHEESPPARVAAFQKVIDSFNSTHPNIKVTQAPQSWADIYAKLYAAVEADSMPDIVLSIPDMTMAMKLTGALQPVDDIVKEVDTQYSLMKSQITPYEYDGHMWAVPMWGMTHLIWYNVGMFEKAGIKTPLESWDDLLAAAKTLTKDGKFGVALPASQFMFTDQNVYNFMATNNCEMFDSAGKVTLDSPQCVKSFELYNELLKYAPPNAISWTWGDAELEFVSQTSGMIMLFPSMAQYMDAEAKGGGPFSAMRVPYPPGGKNGSASYSNGAMVFTKDPARYAAVKEFLLYLHEPDVNGAWLAELEPGVYLPITAAAAKSESFWSNPVIDYYKAEMNLEVEATADGSLFGFEYAPVPVIGRVAGENLLAQIVGKMAISGMTPQEAVTWAANTIREWQLQ